jgi:hypothetical protein
MDDSWNDVVAPLIARCKVASSFSREAVWDANEARTLGIILKRMADIIDAEIDRRAAAELPCPGNHSTPQRV